MNKHEIQYEITSHSICKQNATSEEEKEYHSKKIRELLDLQWKAESDDSEYGKNSPIERVPELETPEEEEEEEQNFVVHLELSVMAISRGKGLDIILDWLKTIKYGSDTVEMNWKIDENTLGVNN